LFKDEWKMRRIVLVVLCLFILGACKDDKTSNSKPDATATPASQVDEALKTRLRQDYDSLTASHQAIAEIWENLADGKLVQCGQYPEVISPETISAEDNPTYQALADSLRQTAIDLDRAVNLWKAECAKPRSEPSPEVINEGLLTVRGAGDRLREAENLLNPPP
jgi:hypothetical protein